MSRKLCSIQQVVSVSPIEGADRVEKTVVLGWEVVTLKGECIPGALVVYCEVDTILPSKPEFEFLKERKYRIKTIKLRGQVSQGICFPLSILPKGNYQIGDDVTEIIGARKHDPQGDAERALIERDALIHKRRLDKFLMRYKWYRQLIFKPVRLPLPAFIKKTDEDRIQLFPNICEEHKDTRFISTEKLDGCSATYFLLRNPKKWQFWNKYIFGICSRNFQLCKNDGSVYWKVAKELDIKSRLMQIYKKYGNDVYVQGEIIGHKVQGNKYGINGNCLFVFNFCMSDGKSKFIQEIDALADELYRVGFVTVPLDNYNFKLATTIPECVELAKGKSTIANINREGIVVRNYEKGLSFKIINPTYLLEHDE